MSVTDTAQTFALPFYMADSVNAAAVDTTTPYYKTIEDTLMLNFQATDTTPVVRESLFKGHSLQPVHPNAIPRLDNSPSPWIFGVTVLAVIALCVYFKTYRIHLGHLLHATIDRPAMDRLLRDCNLTRHREMAPIIIILAAILSITTTLLLNLEGDPRGWTTFAAIWLGLTILIFLRHSFAKLLGNVFDDKDAVSTYISSNYIYYLIEASAAPLLLLAAAYSPFANNVFLTILGIIIFILLTMRLFRGLRIILTFSKYAQFYLFYYLCSLEIVPLIVLIKSYIAL
ncbi:MAG: DUF4271 domain-containing protein [Bacteroidales bacterium]|nr:DUF4271 domain-containing protein [Bacteroidales bacterium]